MQGFTTLQGKVSGLWWKGFLLTEMILTAILVEGSNDQTNRGKDNESKRFQDCAQDKA